ncbi:MAG: radical SAM family heme chaperone HemW, partial [Spirochaetota bacterium]|nr:radical SAM family heme chaperone HemW [Spirochaetota bacterium]
MIPGLYIHIPFCSTKCIYCDFYSIKTSTHKNKDNLFDTFIQSIKKEIEIYKSQIKNNVFSTIYIGGGTPSILPIKHIDSLFSCIFNTFSFNSNLEFTIELNPESTTHEKLLLYKEWGINRISLGCQTFNDTILKAIGRYTSAKEIIEKYNLIRNLGFNNVSIDIIFALVNQTANQYKEDLKIAVSLKPEHISAYSLTLGRKILNSRIEKGIFELTNENDVLKEYLFTHKYLEENGLYFYEVSNFAQKGKESIHNINYWQQKDYLGLGPSACGTINYNRYSNARKLKSYFNLLSQNKLPIDFSETLDSQKIRDELIMLSL